MQKERKGSGYCVLTLGAWNAFGAGLEVRGKLKRRELEKRAGGKLLVGQPETK